MTETIDDIWLGDKLGRSGEALLLEHFIVGEIAALRRRKSEQSYVLAIDAAYGEGKSWFLDRFQNHLALNYPVAFVDAWVDDANDEPLVAIMAAIEDALAPYLAPGSKAAAKFKAVSQAALPVIGKAITGGAAKLAQRYLGDAIFEEVSDEFRKAQSEDKGQASALQDAWDASIEKAGEAVANLVDKQAAEMIANYRKRQVSRESFKTNMAALVASIAESGAGVKAPLFIVVDELDRCRPDYAIRVLEEIKHFFDVPNVAFVIALHGDQLAKSIAAVYGVEFDSEAYLRRFFSRRYELRRLSVAEIVAREYQDAGLQDSKFFAPAILSDEGQYRRPSVPDFIGKSLDDLYVTPRETFPIMDGLRLFHDQWTNKIEIELVALIPMLVNVVRGSEILASPQSKGSLKLRGINSGHGGGVSAVSFMSAASALTSLMENTLPHLSGQTGGDGHGYAFERFSAEFRIEHNSSHISNDEPASIIKSYADVVRLLERFTDDIADEHIANNGNEY